MRIRGLSIFYLLLIILSNCTKSDNGVVAEKKDPIVVTNQEMDTTNGLKIVKEKIVLDKEGKELKPTSEGFKYGEWKFLNVINYYLPDDTDKVNTRILRKKIWILKDQEEFDSDYPDEITFYDDEGKLMGFLSYSDGMYMGDNYEYDDSKRLVSITPIIGDKIQNTKRIVLKYFKDEKGSIVRKNYQGNKLILEEIESKIEGGWLYLSRKERSDNYFYKIHILLDNNKIRQFIDFSKIAGNTLYSFEYENNQIKMVEEKNNEKSLFSFSYFYNKDKLLEKVKVMDYRKSKNLLLKEEYFSDYDQHRNWRKEVITFDTGGKETIIREFTYFPE